MDNIIVIGIVALIVGLAVFYIRKEKRHGVQCVGCPDSKSAPANVFTAADAAMAQAINHSHYFTSLIDVQSTKAALPRERRFCSLSI